MDKHAASADRVVNIDETSCRLLLVHQIGWGRRGVKQAQLQGNAKEATTFTVAFSMDRGPMDMLVQIVHAGKTDAVLPEQPWPPALSPRHVRERGNDDHDPAVRGHIGRRDESEQRRTSVHPSLGHGQHPRQRGHPGRHEGRFPTRRAVLHPATRHVVLAALRRGRLPQLQELHPDAGERHSCPLRPQSSSTKIEARNRPPLLPSAFLVARTSDNAAGTVGRRHGLSPLSLLSPPLSPSPSSAYLEIFLRLSVFWRG